MGNVRLLSHSIPRGWGGFQVEERSKLNRQSSPALQHKVANRISDPALPPRSESFSSGGIQAARTPPMHRAVEPQSAKGVSAFQEGLVSQRPEMPRQNSDPTSENPPLPPRITGREDKFDRTSWLREDDIPPKVRGVPQRTTSISPALVRKNSPGNGPGGLGPRTGSQLIRASYLTNELHLTNPKKFYYSTNFFSKTSVWSSLLVLEGRSVPKALGELVSVLFCLCRPPADNYSSLRRHSNPDLRKTDLTVETALQRTSSGSSSSSSTPSSQAGSSERNRVRGSGKPDSSPVVSQETKAKQQEDNREVTRPSRPASSGRGAGGYVCCADERHLLLRL
ncbi:hypothetical protein JZ751_012902 [Albula glossodonta]|uniref:Uncharacterized protein n=1 Tax=Albula glossodonta TaxID=121402 RepID=A0A8T2MT72_9TELE|nr:hypothetical protein JZ751_012902 [Albula glossodonta]